MDFTAMTIDGQKEGGRYPIIEMLSYLKGETVVVYVTEMKTDIGKWYLFWFYFTP